MDKLKLSLEELVVESFSPATEHSSFGTVHANQSGFGSDGCDTCGAETECGCTAGCPGGSQTCPGWQTCGGATCGGPTCVWPDCTAYGAIC